MNEYELLRAEILNHQNAVMQYNCVLYSVVAAILAFSVHSTNYLLCLIPYLVIVPLHLICEDKNRAVCRISAYMYVFLEGDKYLYEQRTDKYHELAGKQRLFVLHGRIFMYIIITLACAASSVGKLLEGSFSQIGTGWRIVAIIIVTIGMMVVIEVTATDYSRDKKKMIQVMGTIKQAEEAEKAPPASKEEHLTKTKPPYTFKEDVREELIGGKCVVMDGKPVPECKIDQNIYSIFRQYLKGRPCEVFTGRVDVYLTKTDRYIPDVTVVCDRSKIQTDGIHGAPDLVVEVLSPSTGKSDKSIKKDVYEQCGVREYWIVDPVSLRVEQYLLEDGKFVLRDVFTREQNSMLSCMTPEDRAKLPKEFPCGIFPDLMIPLEAVFEDVVEPFIPPEEQSETA